VEFVDGALGFADAVHLHEPEAFGTLGVLVGDDFHVGHGADAGEQLEEVALGGVIGQVADVKTRCGDLDGFGFARLTGSALFARFARPARRTGLAGFVAGALTAFVAAGRGFGGLRREAEERFDFIPQAGRFAGLAGDFEVVAGTRRTG